MIDLVALIFLAAVTAGVFGFCFNEAFQLFMQEGE